MEKYTIWINIPQFIELGGELSYFTIDIYGNVVNTLTGKTVKHLVQRKGKYHGVILIHKKKMYYRLVHRLVATAYIKNPLNKPTVNHLNGEKSDNTVYNLVWATWSENNQHAYDMNLHPKGEDFYNAVITDAEAHIICTFLENRIPMTKISEIVDVPYYVVKDICRRHSWKHISKMYDFTPYNDGPTSLDKVERVCELLANNPKMSYKDIADRAGVDTHVVADISTGHTYKDISSRYNIQKRRTVKFSGFDDELTHKIEAEILLGKTPKAICESIGIEYCKMHKGAIERIRNKMRR